ncbi:MAG: hypothetical protein C5S40_02965 [ANME-2 cluster archaeon]|nr:hypothetical protein [ANME-2 cluster archaeon]
MAYAITAGASPNEITSARESRFSPKRPYSMDLAMAPSKPSAITASMIKMEA